ncbi:MAG: hypothetical protein GYA21_10020 [Myxococcales bacterium]|nr:hypothetical protein [Myxococcales bacterium]
MSRIGAAGRIASACAGGTWTVLVSLAWLAQTGLPSAATAPLLFGTLALGAAIPGRRPGQAERWPLAWLGIGASLAWLAGGAAVLLTASSLDAGLDLSAPRALLVIGPALFSQIILGLLFLPAWTLLGVLLASLGTRGAFSFSRGRTVTSAIALLGIGVSLLGYRYLVSAAGTLRLGLAGIMLLLAVVLPAAGVRRWLAGALAAALLMGLGWPSLEAQVLRRLTVHRGPGSLSTFPDSARRALDRFSPWGRLTLLEVPTGLAAFFDGQISFVLPRDMPAIAEAQALYLRADLAAAQLVHAGDRVAVLGSGGGMLAAAALRLGAERVVWSDPLCLVETAFLQGDESRAGWLAHPRLEVRCDNPRSFFAGHRGFTLVALAAPVIGWTGPLDLTSLEARDLTREGLDVLRRALSPGGAILVPRFSDTDRFATVFEQAASSLRRSGLSVRGYLWPAGASHPGRRPSVRSAQEMLVAAQDGREASGRDSLATLDNALRPTGVEIVVFDEAIGSGNDDARAARLSVWISNLDQEAAWAWLLGAALWMALVAAFLVLINHRRECLPVLASGALLGAGGAWLAMALGGELQRLLVCPLDAPYLSWAAALALVAVVSWIPWPRRPGGPPATHVRFGTMAGALWGAGIGWVGALAIHASVGTHPIEIPATMALITTAALAIARGSEAS